MHAYMHTHTHTHTHTHSLSLSLSLSLFISHLTSYHSCIIPFLSFPSVPVFPINPSSHPPLSLFLSHFPYIVAPRFACFFNLFQKVMTMFGQFKFAVLVSACSLVLNCCVNHPVLSRPRDILQTLHPTILHGARQKREF